MFPFDDVIMDDSAWQWVVVYRVSVVETVLLRTKTACQSLLNNHFYHQNPRVVMMPTLSSTMAMYDCTPVKLSTMIWDHFSWHSKETMFSSRRLNVKITCHFQCSVDIINMVKMKKKILAKCVLAPDFTSVQLGHFTTNHHAHHHRRRPSVGGQLTIFTHSLLNTDQHPQLL